MGDLLAWYDGCMIQLIHGDNEAKARILLVDLIKKAKLQQRSVLSLEGSKLSEGDLETALGSNSLFGETPLVVIEHLLAGVRSKKKTALIEMVAHANTDVIVFENKTLSAAALKQLPTAIVSAFPIANSLFAWLDDLGSSAPTSKKITLLRQALEQEDTFLCFAMLSRQLRLLIQVCTNTPVAIAPFMLTKLKRQAANFSLPTLLKLHTKLYELDLASKQSAKPLDLRQELELLSISR